MCPLHAEDARKIPAKETIFPGRIETPLLLVTLLPFLSPPPTFVAFVFLLCH